VILPDHYGCDRHDPKEMVVYTYKSGRVEKRCLACRRERNNATHNGGDRCRKGGHLKTPFTWRHYGPRQFGRCLPCQYERQRQKRAERAIMSDNKEVDRDGD
jgi:hypothetical protein